MGKMGVDRSGGLFRTLRRSSPRGLAATAAGAGLFFGGGACVLDGDASWSIDGVGGSGGAEGVAGCAVVATAPEVGAEGVPITGELRISYSAPRSPRRRRAGGCFRYGMQRCVPIADTRIAPSMMSEAASP